jgi:hypothetical protein
MTNVDELIHVDQLRNQRAEWGGHATHQSWHHPDHLCTRSIDSRSLQWQMDTPCHRKRTDRGRQRPSRATAAVNPSSRSMTNWVTYRQGWSAPSLQRCFNISPQSLRAATPRRTAAIDRTARCVMGQDRAVLAHKELVTIATTPIRTFRAAGRFSVKATEVRTSSSRCYPGSL